MRARRLLLLLPALALAGCVLSSFEDLTQSGTRRPAPERCGQCHREVYAEWSKSAHARAWVDDLYVSVSSNHEFKTCLPCHAPDSLYTAGELRVRPTGREHGVDCVACHLDGDALVGPLPSTAVVSPHRFRQDRKSYRTSAMCGRCHEGTYAQWKEASAHATAKEAEQATRTCQDCHMPRVTRKVTQPDDALSTVLVSMESESHQRQHRFDLGAIQGFEGAADLHAGVGPTGVSLEVRNRLPHALPTGDYGPSRIEARLDFEDASGTRISRRVLSWSGRLGSEIPALGRARGTVARVPGAKRLEITLLRPADRANAELILARTRIDLP